ncbi:YIP1 family protein [Arcticibacter eurypsychrophilus]|uniref:YIP1 family protein n=1 Tax=Arcticibacter eurypsychrophilus TaxID=1434752 RepID=UPI00084D7F82|nr:YIP1 family protein [Arcticibacter eurypsychrophilus]
MKIGLFNPFTYIAGLKALVIGFIFMAITLVASFYSSTHFDGAIDAHIGLQAPLSMFALEQLIAWGCVVLIFFIAGLILSKSKFRFIDIAGTVALSRAPMLLVAIIGFIPLLHNIQPGHISNAVIAVGIIVLLPVIWMIALLFNGFIISVNVKGTKAIIGFIIALILAEILSVSLNHLIQSFFFFK